MGEISTPHHGRCVEFCHYTEFELINIISNYRKENHSSWTFFLVVYSSWTFIIAPRISSIGPNLKVLDGPK
jgi:hypothetical protein